jgi:outer membrane protein assembly factor BamB/tetratricopeptide (TPR) repeat protein
LTALLIFLQAAGAAPQETGVKKQAEDKAPPTAPPKAKALPKIEARPVPAPAIIIGGGAAGAQIARPMIQLAVPAAAQPAGPGNAPTDNELTDAITLPTDRQIKKRLEAAQDDYIKHEAWTEAAALLQSVLNSKEDVFVPVKRKGRDNQEKVHLVSARKEANRLIGTMPASGLEFYESLYGTQARNLLADAKKKGDREMLADVAFRFFHTEAGAEATDLLGTYHLDRGEPLPAALCYERLLEREGTERLAPLTLFKAALAFRLSGDPSYQQPAEQAWKRLSARVGRDGLKIDDENVGLSRLQAELDKARVVNLAISFNWEMFRGNPSRSAKGQGSAPFLESEWQRSNLEHLHPEAKNWIDKALNQPHRGSEPMLPAFCPIAAGNKLIYRSFWGIHAVDIKTGELAWDSQATAGLNALASDLNKRQEVNLWVTNFLSSNPNILFENSTVETLSSDNRRVYWVDDLAVPPHPNSIMAQPWGLGAGPQMNPYLQGYAQRSRLVAIDLETGKIAWERGDPDYDKSDLKESYFLGPPLPVAGKLYVLTEKNAELRLICLDAARGEPVWTQILATAQDRLANDVSRRVQAVHLAYGEGILVCPTNAGAVLGVDLLSRSLVWAFRYREKPHEPAGMGRFPGMVGRRGMPAPGWPDWNANIQKMSSDWKMSAPIIQEGKLVFTAPDGGAIHCLNLRDGNPLWQAERRDDLYLAGVFPASRGASARPLGSPGIVLLVGKNTCRALSLADGKKEEWQIKTGLPSGLGVASGPYYYLPLKKGEVCKEGGVIRINLEKGRIEGHSPSLRKGDIPGNLLFYEGQVVSQNETSVTSYPQLDYKEAQITRQLEKNPKDPFALTERGELRLYRGDDLAGAVADLRDAVKNNPPAATLPTKARDKLYTTLTELLQQNFDAAQPYLDEYKELCKVTTPDGASAEEKQRLEEEQRRRQANFLCLVAKGREKQGRLVEAFHAYVDFATLAGANELTQVINEPGVQALPTVWARGRIADLVAAGSSGDRKLLEAEIGKRWQSVQASKDIHAWRRFVDTFDSLFAVGREARLQLAERLAEENNYIEAELNFRELLTQTDDPQIAARSIEALARLMTRKGSLEEAAEHYRMLRDSYPKVIVRDGKTGADLFNEISADKRFLPYIDRLDTSVSEGILQATEIPGGYRIAQTYYVFEPKGEPAPFFQHHNLVWTAVTINGVNSFQLKVFDRETNEERWSLSAPPTRAVYDNVARNSARFPFYTKGHLTVLCLGHVVFGLDIMGRKKLWERDLLGPDYVNQEMPFPQYLLSLDGDGRLYLSHSNRNAREMVGQIGAVTATYVCLRTREGLVALDPLRGTVLWKKTDMSSDTQIFGDDEYVYLAEMRGDRSVASTRVVRGRDGASVKLSDFSIPFQHRQRILGGRLLVSENDTLRLYDVRRGTDLWKKSLPPHSVVIRAEEPELVGMVEPDGKVTVVDLRTQQEVFHASVLPEHLEKVTEGLLLQDANQYYVILNRPCGQNVNVEGPWSNFYALRSANVSGTVYAFDRLTGALGWYFQVPPKDSQVPAQALLLEEFKDLPMMVFSVKYHKPANVPGRAVFTPIVSTLSIDKRTGKRVWEKEIAGGYPPHPQEQFLSLEIDRRNGTIDLVSNHTKLRHYTSSSATRADPK